MVNDLVHAVYFVFLLLTFWWYDTSLTFPCGRVAPQMIFLELAVLVGLVNESFSETMDNLNWGMTTVAARGHTLILGWTECKCESSAKFLLCGERSSCRMTQSPAGCFRGCKLSLPRPLPRVPSSSCATPREEGNGPIVAKAFLEKG